MGGLGDGAQGRAPGSCRYGLRRRGLARVRDARRGAPVPRPRRRVARSADRAHAGLRSVGQLAALDDEAHLGRPPRSALDPRLLRHGDRQRLRERLDGHLAAVFLVSSKRRRNGSTGCRGSRCGGRRAHGCDGLPDRVLARVDARSTVGSATTRSRSASTTGTASMRARMQAGHPNWMLDTDRDGPLPHWRSVDRAMERWFFGARRHVPRAAARDDAAGVLRPRALERRSPRARCPSSRRRVAWGSRWWRTSPAGTTRSGRASSRRTATSTSCRTA